MIQLSEHLTLEQVVHSNTAERLGIDNTPNENDMIFFEFARDAANGSDTLAGDAILLGVEIFITTNAGNDA